MKRAKAYAFHRKDTVPFIFKDMLSLNSESKQS